MRGEIPAKRLGKVYRIPLSSLSFAISGLDFDLYQKEIQDFKNLRIIQNEISSVRATK